MTDSLTLSGIRVLDFGGRLSTAWCARLLADYGAEVICVEAPAGHPVRGHPPFHEGLSVPARYFLANRRFTTGELGQSMLAEAQVIITDCLPGDGLDARSILQANGRAIVCAITPYGLTGARSAEPGNSLTVNALSGWASVNGHVSRTPLKSSGYQAAYQAGTFAFGCVLSALTEVLAGRRESTGGSEIEGQIIDIAELEVLTSTFAPAPLRYQYSGHVWPRKQPLDVNDGPVPVADGYFALTISRPAFWIKAMRILGLQDLADDPDLQQAGIRPKYKERFVDKVSQAMSGWKRMDLFDALAAQRVIAGPVLRMDELGDNAQFAARDFFAEAPSGIRFPGPFARMQQSGWRIARELPSKGEPAAESFETRGQIQTVANRSGGQGTGPLSGFRGLVLTQAWAGTYATQLLALLGAEVIQLEVRARLDSWRGTYKNPIPRNLIDNGTAEHPWNVSPLYNSVNLNKKCITVDLSTEDGVALFKQLVSHVDFVAENFSPRVMGNLGLDFDSLTAIKPDLIMASLSAYGATGPWANVPGIGGTIEPSSGMSALLGYEGEYPLNSGQMYPDPAAGLCGFAAIVLALLHRDRTSEGQYIDLSMQEANFTFIGDAWLEYTLTGQVRGPLGNTHPLHAPHGIYPASGEDQWVAISAESDEQWQSLVEVLQLEAPGKMDGVARKQCEKDIDALIRDQTQSWDKHTLAHALTDRGISAAAVHDAKEVAEDPLLRERGHMVAVDHPEAGTYWQSGLPALFSRTPGGVTRAAPLQGEHSFEVFRRLLGMTEKEYNRLVDAEVTGKGPTGESTVANQA